ncbi:MAG TPA: dTDP-4-dehydrorhamnose reductase, partial [Prolixibacteraceae bacterium]|nr:dTDP-4-dehydrorhamnose reductase [Prolixibacteraceae bacterium]
SICGFNYYVIGERYLDEKMYLYPESYHGGNAFHRYADIEVVRVETAAPVGSYDLLKEAWEKYQLPMALTEVHLASTREEQLRWFQEAHDTASRLINEQIDFRAITAWALLGSFDWNSLLKNSSNCYESGVFDIRSGKPRATALANMIKTINSGKPFTSSLLKIPGWWKRSVQIMNNPTATGERLEDYTAVSPLLIFGGNGSLGKALARICAARGIGIHTVNRSEADITSREAIEAILRKKRPWAVVNAAGFSNIDEAERMPHRCFHDNTLGPSVLAEICKAENIKMVTFSTDQVFNGKKREPYHEKDKTSPLNIYGESKKKAEEYILSVHPGTLIIRCSSFFNPWHKTDPLARMLYSGLHLKQAHYLASDIIISPTYIPDLVNTTLDLLIDDESGIWHLSSQEEISLFDFNKLALKMADIRDENIFPVPSSQLNYPALRPKYSVLMSSHGVSLPCLQDALHSYLNELPSGWRSLE